MNLKNDRRFLYVLVSIIFFGILIDQISKFFASEYMQGSPVIKCFWGFIQIMYAENTGSFGSLGSDWPIFVKMILLKAIPIIMMGYILLQLAKYKSKSKPELIGLSLIFSGGISNIADRILSDFVVDYLYIGVGTLGTHVFNFADVFIMMGIGLILYQSCSIATKKL